MSKTFEEPKKIKEDRVIFEKFRSKMFAEYLRHYITEGKGDSWKTCNKSLLYTYLLKSINKYTLEELLDDPDHFIDIANFALFCYHRFKASKEVWQQATASMKGPHR